MSRSLAHSTAAGSERAYKAARTRAWLAKEREIFFNSVLENTGVTPNTEQRTLFNRALRRFQKQEDQYKLNKWWMENRQRIFNLRSAQ